MPYLVIWFHAKRSSPFAHRLFRKRFILWYEKLFWRKVASVDRSQTVISIVLKMIGIMNVPCESPAEFYGAPEPAKLPSKGGPLSLFWRRKSSHQIDYLQDGRKLSDGKLTQKTSAPQLWEQLLVRTFVHKMEDEIQSPIDQYESIQKEFAKLTLKRQGSQSKSTYSLVSQDRLSSSCPKCCAEDCSLSSPNMLAPRPRHRAHSTCTAMEYPPKK
uniref:DDE_Tnp_1_7 domain-containing protein n=1 Tax=Steinernema glaseri TaxID=37863 RepID=A0A1I7ZLW1_9BILA